MKTARRPKTSTKATKVLLQSGAGAFVKLDDGGARRFTKEVLRVGSWIHPGTGEELDFPREDLLDLARDTNAWIDAGNKVWFPTGTPAEDNNHNAAATSNLGFWSNFRLEGELLVADVCVEDDAAVPKIGKTIRDVSVGIVGPQRVQDGRKLAAVIQHVAATPRPALPGQSNFKVALELEGAQTKERIYVAKPAKPGKGKNLKLEGTPAGEAPKESRLDKLERLLGQVVEKVLGKPEDPPAAIALEADDKATPELKAKLAQLEAEKVVLLDSRQVAERKVAVGDVIAQLEKGGHAVGVQTRKLLEATAARGESLDPIVAAVKLHAPKLPPSAGDLAAARTETQLEGTDKPEVAAYPIHMRDQARSLAHQFELIQSEGGKPLRMGLAKFLESNVGRIPAAKKGA